jgi:hypothetical protein
LSELQTLALASEFAICKLSGMRETSPVYNKLVESGVDKGYASQLASGARTPSLKKSIEIFRATGLKLGPIQFATDEAIDSLSLGLAPGAPAPSGEVSAA